MIFGLLYLCRFNRSVISTPTPECEERVFYTASEVPHSAGSRGGGGVAAIKLDYFFSSQQIRLYFRVPLVPRTIEINCKLLVINTTVNNQK